MENSLHHSRRAVNLQFYHGYNYIGGAVRLFMNGVNKLARNIILHNDTAGVWNICASHKDDKLFSPQMNCLLSEKSHFRCLCKYESLQKH